MFWRIDSWFTETICIGEEKSTFTSLDSAYGQKRKKHAHAMDLKQSLIHSGNERPFFFP